MQCVGRARTKGGNYSATKFNRARLDSAKCGTFTGNLFKRTGLEASHFVELSAPGGAAHSEHQVPHGRLYQTAASSFACLIGEAAPEWHENQRNCMPVVRCVTISPQASACSHRSTIDRLRSDALTKVNIHLNI